MRKTIKRMILLFSVIFSMATITSSAYQLSQGIPKDGNLHIIDRAVLVLIGVITVTLFEKITFKSALLSIIVPYAISISIVFFYVWLSSFWEELHPHAYRDVFFNFTAIAIVVFTFLSIKNRILKRN